MSVHVAFLCNREVHLKAQVFLEWNPQIQCKYELNWPLLCMFKLTPSEKDYKYLNGVV